MNNRKIAVVGGGLAGLMAVIKAAEAGVQVDLFSIVPVGCSHSECTQYGNSVREITNGEEDTPWKHMDDRVYGGDCLANQPPLKAMCDGAPHIINRINRISVMFNRTPEGLFVF